MLPISLNKLIKKLALAPILRRLAKRFAGRERR